MGDTEPDGNGRLLKFRVERNENRLDRIEDWRSRVDEDRTTVKGELANVHRDLEQLGDEMRGVRRVMVGLLVTIAASTFAAALTVMLATGRL